MAHGNACQHKAAQLFQAGDKGQCYLNCPPESCQVLLVACHCTSPSLPSKSPRSVTLLVVFVEFIEVCGANFAHSNTISSVKVGYCLSPLGLKTFIRMVIINLLTAFL